MIIITIFLSTCINRNMEIRREISWYNSLLYLLQYYIIILKEKI